MQTAVITHDCLGPAAMPSPFTQRVREGGINDWRCRDPGTASAGTVAAGGSGKVPRYIGLGGCRWLPGWLPGSGPPLQRGLDRSYGW